MRLSKLIIFAIVAVTLVSCDSGTSIVIKQDNPQQFFVSGHGTFDILVVSGPAHERGYPLKDYWVIQSINDIDLSQLPKPIVYGQVPPGFRQYTPPNGPPPPISDGNTYAIKVGVREATGGRNMLFSVRDGKIIIHQDS